MTTQAETNANGTPAAEGKEEVLLVYIGQRVNDKDKLIHIWLQVTPEQHAAGETGLTEDELQENFSRYTGRFRVYDGKAVRKNMTAGVGTVYRVPQVRGTNQIYGGEARWEGLWGNDDERLHWQALDRTARASVAMRKKAKKQGTDDEFAALRQLREEYARLIGRDQRAALLAQIIAFVTGGR